MNDNTIYIRTVQDLINYLQTLDTNKPINGEYMEVLAGNIKDIKTRPLLPSLIKETTGGYIFGPMLY